MEFIRDQYRHGKTLLVLGASRVLIDKAGLGCPPACRAAKPTPGLMHRMGAIEAFTAALAGPRHAERGADPPAV